MYSIFGFGEQEVDCFLSQASEWNGVTYFTGCQN